MARKRIRIPEELKRALTEAATMNGCSEAEVLQAALIEDTKHRPHPKPRLPLFERGMFPPDLAENVDRYLEGFGED